MPRRMPRVSAILPTFNRAGAARQLEYLDAAVRSLRDQTFSDFELLIGTEFPQPPYEDRLLPFLRNLVASDGRIKVLLQHTQLSSGHGPTDNDLHRLAVGEFCTRPLADDELYEPRFLERLVAALDAHPRAVLAYGDFLDVDERGEVLRERRRPEFDRELLQRECFVGICVLYRSAAWRKAGPYSPMLAAEDWDMWRRLACLGDFVRVPEILGRWRDWPGNLTQKVRSGEIVPGKVYAP